MKARQVLCVLLCLALLFTLAPSMAYATVVTPFAVRYASNDTGEITAIGNAASAVAFAASSDNFSPNLLPFSTELSAPNLSIAHTYADPNGVTVVGGDTIEYTFTVSNSGEDAAANTVVTAPIPAGTTYIPGSLAVISGPNAGNKTDAAGDDQAEFDISNNRVVFRLGAGANGTDGGTIATESTTTFRYRVTVNDDVADQTVISSQASGTFRGETTGFELTAFSNLLNITVKLPSADAGLLSVAGQAIAATGIGTSGSPKTASINVANNQSSVALSNIAAAADATAHIYSDSAFSQNEDTAVSLTAGGGTHVYIKVVAEDEITTLYYDVTVSRAVPSATGGGSSKPAYTADISGTGWSSRLPVTVHGDTGDASVNANAQLGDEVAGGSGAIVSMPSIPGITSCTLGLPAAYLATPGGQGTLTFHTDTGSITLPANMLADIPGTGGKNAQITVGPGDKSGLPEETKAAIGGRPLISLSLTLDGGPVAWNNPNAPVTVSIPYTPEAEELSNPERIVIWYIDGNGNSVCVPCGHYDPLTGMVTFKATHFSDYAIGYHTAGFSDVDLTAWYRKAADFIAAREITAGTGDGKFSPDAKLTRGQFIVMLMKAYEIAPDGNPADNFSDAGNAYYTGYLAAAGRLGISSGVGGNLFAPEKEIARQEMFTLLYNALKSVSRLPQGNSCRTLSDFSDTEQIASWAKDAAALLVETGIIAGSDGKLAPENISTRAEMAQILYHLLSE